MKHNSAMGSPKYEVKIRSIETAREYPSDAYWFFVNGLCTAAARTKTSLILEFNTRKRRYLLPAAAAPAFEVSQADFATKPEM
jgi:hypothetical protein